MRRLFLILGLVLVSGCDSEPPSAPQVPDSPDGDILAKWTKSEVASGWGTLVLVPDGRIDCVGFPADGKPYIQKERVTSKGEYQRRVSGKVARVEIETFDTFGLPVELTDGPANAIFRLSERGEQPRPYEFQLSGRFVGDTIDCRSTYDPQAAEVFASRIIVGEQCWEYPVGNSVLACPTP